MEFVLQRGGKKESISYVESQSTNFSWNAKEMHPQKKKEKKKKNRGPEEQGKIQMLGVPEEEKANDKPWLTGGEKTFPQLKDDTYVQRGRSHTAARRMDFISPWQAHRERCIYMAKIRRKSHNGLQRKRASPVN